MNKKPSTIMLGILSFLPVAYMLFWGFYIMPGSNSLLDRQTADPSFDPYASSEFTRFLILEGIGTTLILGMDILFIVKVIRNRELEGSKKWLWGLGIVFGGPVVIPFYYVRFIWPEGLAA